MEIHTFFFFFASVFCAEVEGAVGQHHFFREWKNWKDAQTHCRKHHTDLSYVNNQKDTENILKAAGGFKFRFTWIGLQQDPENATRWKWSGGGYVTHTKWAQNQPDNYKGIETKGAIFDNGQWNDIDEHRRLPFFCIRMSVMKDEKKTWEDAMEHCREKQSDLISIVSETDRLLSQTEMQRNQLTEPVWIGLRFLADQWLWVDGESMVYQAWNEKQNYQQCPVWKRCGALTLTGLWGNYDCVEKRYFLCT